MSGQAPLLAVFALRAQEQARDGLCRLGAHFRVARAQLGQGAVQHFLREATRQGFQHRVHVFTLGQQLLGARDFGSAPFVGLCVELLDQRHHAPRSGGGAAAPSSA